MTTRRDFMQALGALSAATALAPRSARAAGNPDKLVVYFVYGGWDPTYLFDAKPDNPDVATPDGDWMSHGDLTLWGRSGDEDVRGFFRAWADRAAVLNGVAVNSLVHEECVRRLLTGSSTDAVADIGGRVAAALGDSLPLPYLTMGPLARTTGVAAKAGRWGYSNQLMSLTNPDFAWPREGGWRPAPGFVPSGAEDDAVQAWLKGRADALAGRTGGAADAARVADYAEALDRSARIRDIAAGGGFLSDETLFNTYEDVDKVAAALSEGFSQTAFLQDGGYWDTHGGNSAQGGLFNDLFGTLRSLLGALDSAGILDETLVLVLSEMGRTPVLNADAGKDHWPYTSAMLVGGGVRPAVVDGTDEALIQQPVDLQTGVASADGVPLFAPDVLATAAHILGLDAGAMYPDGEVIHAVVA